MHDTRHSERLQDMLVQGDKDKGQPPTKKRSLEGTNLNNHNSFAILNNPDIAQIALDMGVNISVDEFDCVDLMKDLEIARHALDNKSSCQSNTDNVVSDVDHAKMDRGNLLLEWVNEDSEEENFTLVQSKTKIRE